MVLGFKLTFYFFKKPETERKMNYKSSTFYPFGKDVTSYTWSCTGQKTAIKHDLPRSPVEVGHLSRINAEVRLRVLWFLMKE